MEGRPSRGRGGSSRRGGRGGNDGDSFGGEHRGRGRGGHHRGRGKRDHHRGRGRGGGSYVAEFRHRADDGEDGVQEEDDRMEVFSRRKLESNWDRYEESERPGPDDDTPTQRGADYRVLLESAGDSFTQFRFSEEKDWEMDSLAGAQSSAVFVDLPALAQTLQKVPLHQRLNLEAELIQVSAPVALPTVTAAPKQEVIKTFTPPPATSKGLRTVAPSADSQVSSNAVVAPPDDGDEELDRLLGLGKQSAIPERALEELEAAPEVNDEKMEKAKDKDVTPPKSAPVRQEMTEEDLEDWLDSMIS